MSTRADDVLAIVREHGPQTWLQLADRTGRSVEALRTLLHKPLCDGRLRLDVTAWPHTIAPGRSETGR